MREGHIETVKLMIELGANADHQDTKAQRPIFYAIDKNKIEMVKFLISQGMDIHKEDKKKITPTVWAKKQNKPEILSILLEHGGQLSSESTRPKAIVKEQKSKQTVVEPVESKPVPVNEKKVPRRYMLTVLREGGYHSPMTNAEFEDFKRNNPALARYFETDEEGEALQPLSQLQVPEVPESALIFDQWEKAAQRMMQNLYRNPKSYIFQNPVNYEELKIPDYPMIVKNPMDFSTIKTKLKEHKYQGIGDFMADMDLVFYNCRLYNGTESDVGKIGVAVNQEYIEMTKQLYFDFYKREQM